MTALGRVLLQHLVLLRIAHDSISGGLRSRGPGTSSHQYTTGTARTNTVDNMAQDLDAFLEEVRARLLQAQEYA